MNLTIVAWYAPDTDEQNNITDLSLVSVYVMKMTNLKNKIVGWGKEFDQTS